MLYCLTVIPFIAAGGLGLHWLQLKLQIPKQPLRDMAYLELCSELRIFKAGICRVAKPNTQAIPPYSHQHMIAVLNTD